MNEGPCEMIAPIGADRGRIAAIKPGNLSKKTKFRILRSKIASLEDNMNYRIAVLSVFVGIAIGSLCIGQGKPTGNSRTAPDAGMSDHDRIEKLLGEVAELQNKLAALTRRYDVHTHQMPDQEVAQLPGSIECDQTVVQWTNPGIAPQPVYKVCRQLMSGGGLRPGSVSTITGPPRP